MEEVLGCAYGKGVQVVLLVWVWVWELASGCEKYRGEASGHKSDGLVSVCAGYGPEEMNARNICFRFTLIA